MSFNPLEIAKKYPLATGVGVFAIGVVLVLMFSGGGDDAAQPIYTTSGTDPSTVAANSALAQSQIQAGVQNNAVAAQLQTNLADIASRDKAIELSSKNENLGLTLQSNVALAQIAAQKDTQQMISTLTASVTNAQTEAQRMMNENNNSTQLQIQKLGADVASTQAKYNAEMLYSMNTRDITVNAQNNAAQAALAGIYANTTIQTQAIQAGTTNNYINAQKDMFTTQVTAQKDMFNTQAFTQRDMFGMQIGAQNLQTTTYGDIQKKQIDAKMVDDAARNANEQQKNAWAAYQAERDSNYNFLLGNAKLYQDSVNHQFNVAMMMR